MTEFHLLQNLGYNDINVHYATPQDFPFTLILITQAACRVGTTTEIIQLYGVGGSCIQRILASKEQVALQKRYDFDQPKSYALFFIRTTL